VSLPDPDFEEAKKRALVRSTVTRPEVNAFRKELQQIRSRSGDEVELLKRERSDLLREDEKLRARQAEVKARLHEIEQKLGIQ
jgi:predicted nuclease with TOPRIM domain